MPVCNVCESPLGDPVYRSEGPTSLTSHCELHPGRTELRYCDRCGHLQTPEMEDVRDFYATGYNILTASEEEDQLYRIVEGRPVYRSQHEVDTFLAKVDLRAGSSLLDYGSGKGAFSKRLLASRPDLVPHLFEVSPNYQSFWREFVPADRCAVDHLPDEWAGRFDAVAAFFVLEHVAHLAGWLTKIRGVLRPSGYFYFLVPNVYANIADLVVADHVNHFSPTSLAYLLQRGGFDSIEIDPDSHESAFVVLARKDGASGLALPESKKVSQQRDEVMRMSGYWTGIGERARKFEEDLGPATRTAVYGSGFYGAFLATCVREPARVVCFLDRNPHRQKQLLFAKPIRPPEALPEEVGAVYVGLNPRISRAAIAEIPSWAGRRLAYFFP